ncbi:MAG: DUF29 family protein [Gloeomargarita sp. GMQP_bins_44]
MNSLYEADFYAWTQAQAQALAQRDVTKLDWPHLQEEIAALGRQEYRELVSCLTVLIGHLLKWDYQPDRRSRRWFLTIREQRRAMRRHLRRNPSLQALADAAMTDAYEAGVDLALRETDIPLRMFPETCPYSFAQALADDFLWDTSGDWSGNASFRPRACCMWTSADLALLPDKGKRYEIVDGKLLVTPAPHWKHQKVLATLRSVVCATGRLVRRGAAKPASAPVRFWVSRMT